MCRRKDHRPPCCMGAPAIAAGAREATSREIVAIIQEKRSAA